MSNYLYWNKILEFVVQKNNKVDLTIFDEDYVYTKDNKSCSLDFVGFEIISKIDGTRTKEELISELSCKYNDSVGNVGDIVSRFLEKFVNEMDVKLFGREICEKINVFIREENTKYPKIVSIEITNTCNIKCLHCYGNYGALKKEMPTLDQIKSLFDELKALGVNGIEITGGECTTHPDFTEILRHAYKLNFASVCILTNGINLNDAQIELMKKNRSSTSIQIDLHSLDDDYVTWFTKRPNTTEKIKENIIKVKTAGIVLRVATIITRNNYSELPKIGEWLYEYEIRNWGISPVISLGRAQFKNDELILTLNDQVKLEEILEKLYRKYKNDIRFNSTKEHEGEVKNCGAIVNQAVIDSKGNLKMCTMDTGEYFGEPLGNVYKTAVKGIYDSNVEFLEAFAQLKSPNPSIKECKQCEHIRFCGGCILRGILKAKEIGDKCFWYKDVVSPVIKKQYPIDIA
ncbi:hypothetical protein A5821_000093 [Enterococcus sp. 7F3_DIV0205]|uniref:Radical SAM core domain-containing protein n=1 Tax=Candidatus Enterococcus palustris TaxID=1834189 RepID=A0AAQ3W964_9ENTE|nr:radical SAM protein [Enterococcus sp. 7F3_DIV0205]OTN84499.1 hypothetical protein A5821_000427 [Enterococcus sp. 7F3_DIV0205]